MSAEKLQQSTALDLLERAVHALRTAPLQVLLCYGTGTAPFVLGALYFHHVMSRRADASAHLAWASLAMASLFLWMKFWQAMFAIGLQARVSYTKQAPLTTRGRVRILLIQSIVQPLGLFLLPLSLIAVVPFPWVYGFFQGCTAQAGPSCGLRESIQRAAAFSSRCARGNTTALLLLAFFGLVVFFNVLTFILLLPMLAKMLFGVDWQVTRNLMAMLNSTMFAVTLALCYVCLDPIAKSLFVLRNFEFQSRHTGEDLLADLRGLRTVSTTALLCLLLALCAPRAGAEPVQPPAAPGVANVEAGSREDRMTEAVRQTLAQDKYSWRNPVQKEGLLDRMGVSHFFNDIIKSTKKVLNKIGDWIEKVWRKIFPERNSTKTLPIGGWAAGSNVLMWLLLSTVVAVLAVTLMRWRRSKRKTISATALQVQPVPDVSDENVGPEQLPEDGWTRLGRELLAKGEHRLALRAFFLSGLALLGERNVVTLARFKSNRDYDRELRRRAHEKAGLADTFASIVATFESAWYGHTIPDEPAVLQVADAVQSMRAAL